MTTSGQERALRELERLHAAAPDDFELVDVPLIIDGRLRVTISLRLGAIEKRDGGLDLREREEFILSVPADFPFVYPSLYVTDDRFASFPHVIWSSWICLYQSKLEWNPADGLYGFFERLRNWLWKAAVNDMDPLEGPLEPPHHVTVSSQAPFVIRCNAPVAPGETWFGLAELEKFPNRTELVAWNDLTGPWPQGRSIALAIILPKALPMQFPKKGADLFTEFLKQGVDRHQIIRNLAIAALLTAKGDPIHLVVGLPMRRAADGSPRIHIAVWNTPSSFADSLRTSLPENSDTESLRAIRQEIADILISMFELSEIAWCQIMEDRSEIVVRRDKGTATEWFAGKKILILGCGALGSWAAEILARLNPNTLHVLDNAVVKPGLLARQNFLPADIGSKKADALALRLKAIVPSATIEALNKEAHGYLAGTPDNIRAYDVILDCTASNIFQMKLERDWGSFGGRTPPVLSFITDAKAKRCLCVCINENSTGGIWDAYVQLKYKLCSQGAALELISAFYSEKSAKDLFQPEPGCSDPTFSGATADVSSITSTAMNLAAEHWVKNDTTIGIAFSAHSLKHHGETAIIRLTDTHEVRAGNYRIRIAGSVYREAKAWVRKNNRVRSRIHETGGLLWGYWDDAVGIIWVFDASGPPPDSLHDPGRFICGVEGTAEEHHRRIALSRGTCGFVGFWHTHPGMESHQSTIDIGGMANLVSHVGQNQKRSLMVIFGRTAGKPTANFHVYESHSLASDGDLIGVGLREIELEESIV